MRHRWINGALVAALLAAPIVARSAEQPVPALPDEDFLEYLGSWDGDDADWLVVKGPEASAPSAPAHADRGTKDSKREGDHAPSQEQSR
jgi:hypothetical protein